MRIFVLICSLFSSAVFAEWNLNSDLSTVSFVSTKQQHIREIHKFNTLVGNINDANQLSITVDLASIDSGIGIRDQRMKEMLFEIAKFPTAVIKSDLEGLLDESKLASPTMIEVPATIELHGKTKKVTLNVLVAKTKDNQLLVTLTKPLIISAADYNLQLGIEALRKVAGLTSIGFSIPVNAALVFTPK